MSEKAREIIDWCRNIFSGGEFSIITPGQACCIADTIDSQREEIERLQKRCAELQERLQPKMAGSVPTGIISINPTGKNA